jgi:hypothetical protein
LKHPNQLEDALALIIRCTRRVRRPKDIVTLADNILYSKQQMGGLNKVAEAVRLSEQQLLDFLAVGKLCSEARKLVARRVIDSVDVVKTLSGLPANKQMILASYLAAGSISSKDVRIITSFAKKFPQRHLDDIVKNYNKSKDKRVYVLHFALPLNFRATERLRSEFQHIVGVSEITKFDCIKNKGTLEITPLGYKKLREEVRRKQTTIRKLVTSIIDKLLKV